MCFEEGTKITEQDKLAGFVAVEVETVKPGITQPCPVKRVGASYCIVKGAAQGHSCYKVQYFGITGPREKPEVNTGVPPQKLRWYDSPKGQFESVAAAERHIAGDPDQGNTFATGNNVNE